MPKHRKNHTALMGGKGALKHRQLRSKSPYKVVLRDGIYTYHIELRERPTMVWDFHSLLLQIQMLFTVMLTDDGSTITCCDNCGKVFVAVDSTEYCCAECESEVKGDE